MSTNRGRRAPGGAPSGAIDASAVALPPAFDGYPYLVTRIGRTPLRHIAIVPADWSRDRLVDLARRQAEINQLETCVCLGPTQSVFVTPGEPPVEVAFVPVGDPVVDRLVVAGPIPDTAEQAVRRDALRDFSRRHRGSGYLVGDGLEDGRTATRIDLAELSGTSPGGLPRGLRPCTACGRARGEFLALRGEGNGDRTPRVLTVHCRCDNHNRCAGCGGTLHEDRLSAWIFHRGSVCYVAAYSGLGHRCG